MDFDKRALKYRLDKGFDITLVPKRPGIYIFMDEEVRPIYVGKAKVLRNRLSSYLRKGAVHPPKTEVMLRRARYLDVIVTASEKEALILEAELIGELKPRYNIRLRDDKAYPFLRIGTGSAFPRLSLVRKRRRDGALYFGPYTSSTELRRILNLISSLFRPRTCTDSYMKNRSRPCLKYQVGKCSAPCAGRISEKKYQETIERIRQFLNGKTAMVLKGLKKEMEEAALALNFERAAMLRDSIQAIEGVVEEQNVVSKRPLELDVIAIELRGACAQAAVLKVREGILRQKQAFGLKTGLEEDMGQIYFNFIRLFYANTEIPREIVIPEVLSEKKASELSAILTGLKGKRVFIGNAKRGIRRRLFETARVNASQKLDYEISLRDRWSGLSLRLKRLFGLKTNPYRVEGVDISNTSGLESVGSLVCFKGGLPAKDCYRQYNIGISGPDDYAMIRQVVHRRIKRGLEAGDLPHLFIIDGGRGQLSAAIQSARELSALDSLDIISIAKDRTGEGEKIYLPQRSEPIFLDRGGEELRFCQRVRDEAHRFGITRHRKRRTRKALTSVLSSIPGVGERRKALLLAHFGSVKAIASAPIEELKSVPGLPLKVAKAVYDFFREEETKRCQR